jgi:AcrR family transcriptional regulator
VRVEATTLRERKKAATRQALHEAALRLAAERGLDNLTRDAIADEANVSRRTFSNYFLNKEDALLYGDQQRIAQLLETLRSRPPHEPAWQALTAAAMEQFGRIDHVDQGFIARQRLVSRHPSLLARQMAIQASLAHELAQQIMARLPEPSLLQARIMAATFLATIRVALDTWIEQQGPSSISAAIIDGLGRAAREFV